MTRWCAARSRRRMSPQPTRRRTALVAFRNALRVGRSRTVIAGRRPEGRRAPSDPVGDEERENGREPRDRREGEGTRGGGGDVEGETQRGGEEEERQDERAERVDEAGGPDQRRQEADGEKDGRPQERLPRGGAAAGVHDREDHDAGLRVVFPVAPPHRREKGAARA